MCLVQNWVFPCQFCPVSSKNGKADPFLFSVQCCPGWRMPRTEAQQPGSVLLSLHLVHLWGSWNPEWGALSVLWALLRCPWSPVLLGGHRVTDVELTAGSPQLCPLGDLCWLQYLWWAGTWGKGSKSLPAALWDTLGLVSPAVLGFIRLCRSTKLSFCLILFLSLTPRYFPVLPRTVEPVGRFRDRISRQLKSHFYWMSLNSKVIWVLQN